MSTVPKILQNLRKRDDKSRTFAPLDNTTVPSSLKCIDEELSRLKNPYDKSRTFAPPDNTTAPSSLKCIDEELSRLKNPDHKKYSFEDKLTFDEVKKLLILK